MRDNMSMIDRLADIEHERWSKWMRGMFDNWTDENVDRWKRQMHTRYADLPEYSKESDRKEVRTTLEALMEPTEAMLDAVDIEFGNSGSAEVHWQAMLKAAQKTPTPLGAMYANSRR